MIEGITRNTYWYFKTHQMFGSYTNTIFLPRWSSMKHFHRISWIIGNLTPESIDGGVQVPIDFVGKARQLRAKSWRVAAEGGTPWSCLLSFPLVIVHFVHPTIYAWGNENRDSLVRENFYSLGWRSVEELQIYPRVQHMPESISIPCSKFTDATCASKIQR